MESEPGHGSTFSAYFRTAVTAPPVEASEQPIMSSDAVGQHLQTLSMSPKLRTRAKRPYCMLLVEDNQVRRFGKMHYACLDRISQINQKFLKRQLEKQKCTVLTADHGGICIDMLLNRPDVDEHEPLCDVILMDIEMPEVDGLSKPPAPNS